LRRWLGWRYLRLPAIPGRGEEAMKINLKSWVLALGAFAFTLATAPAALASCGGLTLPLPHHSSFQLHDGTVQLMPAALLKDDDDNDNASIVGMWHVVFTGQTMNGGSYTLPQPFDNSVVVWHNDGTEIMNSSRPAQDGNFCLGVWKQTGRRQYFLNHIPWQGNDPFGNPQDGAQLLEQVTLSPDGNHYSGRFTFQAYDDKGNPTLALTGVLTATRITTSTPFSSLL
jgi:hypothetical protein